MVLDVVQEIVYISKVDTTMKALFNKLYIGIIVRVYVRNMLLKFH